MTTKGPPPQQETGTEPTLMRSSGAQEAPALEPTAISAPVELPGLELLRLLGRGGMGEVWLARQRSLERTVAVKVLPPKLAQDPEFVSRFEKEATALAALSHPNIIQIIDRGVAGEHYYFVMEYVEGRSLRELTGKLTPQESLRMALQVARAMECAHESGIVHRDLKPENVLVDMRGHVKVADFGLAGIRRPDSQAPQLTATAVAMGTINYMAPEQRKDARSVDGRADLFSLGVILYELLTGTLPVGRFKLPSERVAGLDKRVDELVARLLEAEPEARHARAREVCEVLEGLMSTASRPALPAEVAPAPERRGWGRKARVAAVVGACVGMMGAGALGVWLLKRPAAAKWPPNTEANLFTRLSSEEEEGRLSLELTFQPGSEEAGDAELNAHSGQWSVVAGRLEARQGGDEPAPKSKLVPRTYLADRYFLSDDFAAEVQMELAPLGPDYPEDHEAQHYGELSFRVKGTQVSVFAIPGVGMRLLWRYSTKEGDEVVGNSARDLEEMVADEAPVPQGPFKVKLVLRKQGEGVQAEAWVNGESFARKYLRGLNGQSGKVAVGCRNLACTFRELEVEGTPRPRPKRGGSSE